MPTPKSPQSPDCLQPVDPVAFSNGSCTAARGLPRRTRLHVHTLIATGALVLAMGCLAGPLAKGNPVHPDFEHKTYAVGCDDGRRYAVKTLTSGGYRLTAVERNGADTVVEGKNERDKLTARLTVKCGPQGVMFEPATASKWAADSLRFAFDKLVEAGDRIWPPPTGPVLRMDLYRGQKAKIEFPAELEPLGVVAVRVFFLNAGERSVRIDPRRIRGVDDGGRQVPPLSQADAEKKLASMDPDIKSKLLKPMTLTQGTTTIGFVFLPVASYQGASMAVIDDKTGEEDGYDASFPAES